VPNITETTTVYTSSIGFSEAEFGDLNLSIFPNPASDLIAIQIQELVKDDLRVSLLDLSGRVVKKATINKGSTIAYFDVQTVYEGTYIVQIQNGSSHNSIRQKIVILRD
jgi:hypothetical protein